MTNHCGTCTACCRVFDIAEVQTPAGKWCDHCDIGRGCKIYNERPEACRDIRMLLAHEPEAPDPLHISRLAAAGPMQGRVRAPTNEKVIAALTMPGAPLAWQRKDVRELIEVLVEKASLLGRRRSARSDAAQADLDRDGERDVRMSEPDEDGMQYNID